MEAVADVDGEDNDAVLMAEDVLCIFLIQGAQIVGYRECCKWKRA